MTTQEFEGSRNYVDEHVSNFIWEEPVGTLITILIKEGNLVYVHKQNV